MRSRGAVKGLLAAVALTGALEACRAERERLDVPQLKLTVDQQAVARGGDITGTVTATDQSGLAFLGIGAFKDDTLISRFPPGVGAGTLYGDDSITTRFILKVTCAVPDGAPVQVLARTFDNQGFEVVRYDTVIARGAICSQSGGAQAR